jgi:hypothetical protein
MQLTSIANDKRTDKGTVQGQSHGYTILYDMLFATRRMEPLNLLEIGLCIGGPELATGSADRTITDAPSVAMWHEYFPNAHIYGVDISDFSQFETEWFSFFRADCGDDALLTDVAARIPLQDIIVDDGSHAAYHQQLTFLKLFPRLKPGGLFVIEDMQWQPEEYQRTLPKVPRTDLLLSRFIQSGRFEDTGAIAAEKWADLAPQIANVIQFDEDWFYMHRRLFNARTGARPERAVIWDAEESKRRSQPGFAKRLLARIRSDVSGGEGEMRRPRVKMAIIQKA